MPSPARPEPDAPRTIRSLDELADLVDDAADLYVRWTAHPDTDLDAPESVDELTGVPLPGLSANALTVEPWWGRRSRRMWVARRLYDYNHLQQRRGPDTRPWIFRGVEVGRGPDNEPLIERCELVAGIALEVIREARQTIDDLPADWGSLQRT